MSTFSSSSKREQSQRTKGNPTQRPFGRLVLDTTFTRLPEQRIQSRPVLPYESKTDELTFIAFDDVKARLRSNFSDATGAKEPLQPGPKRSATFVQQPVLSALGVCQPHLAQSRAAALCETTPRLDQRPRYKQQIPFQDRLQGRRPEPLDLSQHVTAVTSRFSADTKTPATAGMQYLSWKSSSAQRHGYDIPTPTIVITPAKEDFDLDLLDQEFAGQRKPRPSSSVYSRYTNCMPKSTTSDEAPPVPPLPSFKSPQASHEQWLGRSAKTEADTHESPVPTPRRSRGWWNVITSPFSAPFSARSATGFWRSPSIREDDYDQMPILRDVASIGSSNPHAGVIFTNRRENDDELRSAPVSGPSSMPFEGNLATQRRSNSAPGALGSNEQDFNIYEIPNYGEAVSYFNPHKHFPSLVFSPTAFTESPKDLLQGWSPSHSVAFPHRDLAPDDRPEDVANEGAEEQTVTSPIMPTTSDALVKVVPSFPENGPLPAPPGPIETDRGIFSSPAEHELRSIETPYHQPARNFTQATNDTLMSSLSATPVVEKAQIAAAVGPQSAFAGQREVDVERSRAATPLGPPLGANTMSHESEVNEPVAEPRDLAAKTDNRQAYQHIRQDSYGLGISGTHNNSPRPTPPELPPPPTISEKSAFVPNEPDQLRELNLEAGNMQPSVPWYRRFLWVLVSSAAGLMMLLVVLLVLFVSQRHEDMPVEAQWLHLDGFPAIPTGVATVIQPHNVKVQNQCVSPPNLWSCAVPVEDALNEPNFRFEIRFRNGTLPRNETFPIPPQNSSSKRDMRVGSDKIRRSAWSDYLFTSDPSPPSQDDQVFLGMTSDNISMPYNGEETPFWISLLDASALEPASSSLHKRADSNFTYPYPSSEGGSTSKNASTAAPTSIPSPLILTNGEPLQQQLYPQVTAQPIRLFNRGQDSEHYGFYTYFDRTVYVSTGGSGSNASTVNMTLSNIPLANASAVCTWSQTRLLVQMWTRKSTLNSTSPLLSSKNVNSSSSSSSSDGSMQPIPAGNSTANDLHFPGSFPLPVSITVDRHGGDAGQKGVYCYGLDPSSHTVLEKVKAWVAEQRAAGGSIVHPAAVPGSNGTTMGLSKRDTGNAPVFGGIDGGTGGCSCQWQNWS